jgi:hypothetical protein
MEKFINKLMDECEKKLEESKVPPINFAKYGCTESELRKFNHMLKELKKASEHMFWVGYKEALCAMQRNL